MFLSRFFLPFTTLFVVLIVGAYTASAAGVSSENSVDFAYSQCMEDADNTFDAELKECSDVYQPQNYAYTIFQRCLAAFPSKYCFVNFYAEPVNDQWALCRAEASANAKEAKLACESLIPEEEFCVWDSDLEAEITYLGTLDYDGTYALTEPYAVRNDGTVVGKSKINSSEFRPFVWTKDEMDMQGLNIFGGGKYGYATDINDNDLVVGRSGKNSKLSEYYPVLWNGLVALPFQLSGLPGPLTNKSEVTAINEEGYMVGMANVPGKNNRHVVWDNEGNITELPGLWAGTTSFPSGYAYDINESNSIVGWSKNTAGKIMPVYWTFLGGDLWEIVNMSSPAATSGQARAINNNEVAVGFFNVNDDDVLGFVWTVDSGQEQLAPLAGDTDSYALDIADNDWIVGYSGDNEAAVLWPGATGCTPVNLQSVLPAFSGWTLENATAISPNGRYIVGTGKLTGVEGEVHGWLIDLYPEIQ